MKQRNYLVASFEYFCAKLGINIPDSSSKAQEELRLKSIKFSSFLLAENTSKSSNLANSSNPNLEASQKLMSDPDPEEQELTKAKDALEMEFAAFSEEEKHLMRRELLIESVVYSDDTDKETPERIQHKKEMEKRETSPKGFILGIASFLAFYYIVNWIENF